MSKFPFKKVLGLVVCLSFLFSDFALGANRSLFQNKKPNYQSIIQQNENIVSQKKALSEDPFKVQGPKMNQELKIDIAGVEDISDIHIPESLGRISEVYNAPQDPEPQGFGAGAQRRIIHFQDLHTQYDAQKNSAKLIEHLYKTYNIDLVLSEGAFGKIDGTKIKEFIIDKITRDLASKLLMKTGELTGEEYVILNKDEPIQVLGVEDKGLYYKNVQQFNKVIKYSENAEVFLEQVDKVIKELKPVIYNKTIKDLEEKEALYNDKKMELNAYLNELTQIAKELNLDITNTCPNITVLQKSLDLEKNLQTFKVAEELRLVTPVLSQELTNKGKTKELEEFNTKYGLFQQEKISPAKFYIYLRDLGKSINSPITNYKNLSNFTDYLQIISKIESYKIYTELQTLLEELKYKSCDNEGQKNLLTVAKNVAFLKDFFNLKVSNEEIENFLTNKDKHTTAYFKQVITSLTNKTNLTNQTTYIDYNPELIENHFNELIDFYNVVWERDKKIVENSLKRMEENSDSNAILIVGGFHTKGMMKMFRDKGISYVVLSANSNSDMDDALYHELLAGKRKSAQELIPLAKGLANESLRLELLLDDPSGSLTRLTETSVSVLGERLRIGAPIAISGGIFNLDRNVEGTVKAIHRVGNNTLIAYTTNDGSIGYVNVDTTKKEIRVCTKEEFDKAIQVADAGTGEVAKAEIPKPKAGFQQEGDLKIREAYNLLTSEEKANLDDYTRAFELVKEGLLDPDYVSDIPTAIGILKACRDKFGVTDLRINQIDRIIAICEKHRTATDQSAMKEDIRVALNMPLGVTKPSAQKPDGVTESALASLWEAKPQKRADVLYQAGIIPALLFGSVIPVEVTHGPFLSDDKGKIVMRITIDKKYYPYEGSLSVSLLVDEKGRTIESKPAVLKGIDDKLIVAQLPEDLQKEWRDFEEVFPWDNIPFRLYLTPSQSIDIQTIPSVMQRTEGVIESALAFVWKAKPHKRADVSYPAGTIPALLFGRVIPVEVTHGPFFSEDKEKVVMRITIDKKYYPYEGSLSVRLLVDEKGRTIESEPAVLKGIGAKVDKLIIAHVPEDLQKEWRNFEEVFPWDNIPFRLYLTPAEDTELAKTEGATGAVPSGGEPEIKPDDEKAMTEAELASVKAVTTGIPADVQFDYVTIMAKDGIGEGKQQLFLDAIETLLARQIGVKVISRDAYVDDTGNVIDEFAQLQNAIGDDKIEGLRNRGVEFRELKEDEIKRLLSSRADAGNRQLDNLFDIGEIRVFGVNDKINNYKAILEDVERLGV